MQQINNREKLEKESTETITIIISEMQQIVYYAHV